MYNNGNNKRMQQAIGVALGDLLKTLLPLIVALISVTAWGFSLKGQVDQIGLRIARAETEIVTLRTRLELAEREQATTIRDIQVDLAGARSDLSWIRSRVETMGLDAATTPGR